MTPKAVDVKGFDLAVVVKRPQMDLVGSIHRTGIPLVWDVVDAWPQPEGNSWDRPTCLSWLKAQVALVGPSAIIAATKAMARDCAEFGIPVLYLPHHYRPGIEVNPIRERVKVVGYEGGQKYLGHWESVLRGECARRGWQFLVNPDRLSDLDIVVALRDAQGYAATHWKSNVKAANAQGSGTPLIANREAGYTETACGAEWFADAEEEVSQGLDALEPQEVRQHAAQKMLAAAPALDVLAARYKEFLRHV